MRVLDDKSESRAKTNERVMLVSRTNTQRVAFELEKSAQVQHLVIALAQPQHGRVALQEALERVSTPSSASYGLHVDDETLREWLAAPKEALEAVGRWLAEAGLQVEAVPEVQGEVVDDKARLEEVVGAHVLQMLEGKRALVKVHSHGDFVSVFVPLRAAERLLDATFHEFVYHGHGDVRTERALAREFRAMEYSVPEYVAPHVDFVGGAVRLSPQHTRKHVRGAVKGVASNAPVFLGDLAGDGEIQLDVQLVCKDGSTPTSACSPAVKSLGVMANGRKLQYSSPALKCGDAGRCSVVVDGLANYEPVNVTLTTVYADDSTSEVTAIPFQLWAGRFVTPSVLKEYYGVPHGLVGSQSGNSQSVAEFLDQYYAPSDLDQFLRVMGLPPVNDMVSVVGPNNASQPGGEATVDIEYMVGIAGNISTVFWSQAGLHSGQERFLTWLLAVEDSDSKPLVHSISYSDEEHTLSLDYMQRINTELQKLGALGLSIMFCSLDDGAVGPSARNKPELCSTLRPVFPASSPWATAVGATQFSTQTAPICSADVGSLGASCEDLGEITCSADTGGVITSGGGTSLYWPRPEYQYLAVEEFMQTSPSLPPEGFPGFNASRRAYPDLSLNGHNWLIVMNGELSPIHGTSLSTPGFAAMVALINDERLAAGKPPLGFLNPLIYANAGTGVFRDVVMGDNHCTVQTTPDTVCCEQGYEAQAGWDATTGVGVPVFEEMRRLWV